MPDYHVHVFFSLEERGRADDVARQLEETFGLSPCSWTGGVAGPFLSPMFQVNVPSDAFAEAIPWLMLHRGEFPVLVHPLTGDDLGDHTRYAAWLGEQQPLRLDVF
jgi:aromatic ring-cleaving dioxygenase